MWEEARRKLLLRERDKTGRQDEKKDIKKGADGVLSFSSLPFLLPSYGEIAVNES